MKPGSTFNRDYIGLNILNCAKRQDEASNFSRSKVQFARSSGVQEYAIMSVEGPPQDSASDAFGLIREGETKEAAVLGSDQ